MEQAGQYFYGWVNGKDIGNRTEEQLFIFQTGGSCVRSFCYLKQFVNKMEEGVGNRLL